MAHLDLYTSYYTYLVHIDIDIFYMCTDIHILQRGHSSSCFVMFADKNFGLEGAPRTTHVQVPIS